MEYGKIAIFFGRTRRGSFFKKISRFYTLTRSNVVEMHRCHGVFVYLDCCELSRVEFLVNLWAINDCTNLEGFVNVSVLPRSAFQFYFVSSDT